MANLTREQMYQAGMKYVNGLEYADRPAYAQEVVFAVLNNQPYPDHTSYKLARNADSAAQQRREAEQIQRRVRAVMYP